jgi:putative protease
MNAVKPETGRPLLIAPAGNLQKLKVAIAFGADAVYLSGRRLSLRAQAENFSPEQMADAVEYAHLNGARVYTLLNVFPHNENLADLREELQAAAALKPDAIVVSDLGAFELARETAPDIPIHISTQANVTNLRTAMFWARLGASGIILARELRLEEVSEIALHLDIGVEIFIHGAMCMAYSGRCFMSKHFVGRDSNLGDCAQPCRWRYRLVEEKRPYDILDVEESIDGTVIFSSRDLCMIEHIPEVVASGVRGLKIEGRMKSVYYVGVTTRAYRQALDAFSASPDDYRFDPAWLEEIGTTSNREFTTGFYLGEMQKGLTPSGGAERTGTHSFLGIVTETIGVDALIEVRNRFEKGDGIQCVQPCGSDFEYVVGEMFDEAGSALEVAQPNQFITIPGLSVERFTLLRNRR